MRRKAPRWAVPILSAHVVASSHPHYLRRLSDEDFGRLARACDVFLLVTIALPMLLAFFLPSPGGSIVLIAASVWGVASMVLVGRRTFSERRRRQSPPKF